MKGAAAALYKKAPSAQELSAFGLTSDDVEEPAFEVWPDNWPAVLVFVAMSTQWRIGPNGPTGLDYNVLPEIWRRTKTPPAQRDQIFESLRILEDAALGAMRKQ